MASGGGPELAGVHGAEMVSAAATALPATNKRNESQFINFSLEKIILSFSLSPPASSRRRPAREGGPHAGQHLAMREIIKRRRITYTHTCMSRDIFASASDLLRGEGDSAVLS